jgi:hypothetical protein
MNRFTSKINDHAGLAFFCRNGNCYEDTSVDECVSELLEELRPGSLYIKTDKAALLLSDERGPVLSDYCEGSEPYRRDRLCRVVGYMMSELNCDLETLKTMHGLLGLHDHKGNLTSIWLTLEQCAIAYKKLTFAWMRECEYSHEAIIYIDDSDNHLFIDLSPSQQTG